MIMKYSQLLITWHISGQIWLGRHSNSLHKKLQAEFSYWCTIESVKAISCLERLIAEMIYYVSSHKYIKYF